MKRALVVFCLLAPGCVEEKKPDPAAQKPPTIVLSAQPGIRFRVNDAAARPVASGGIVTDGREKIEGARLHSKVIQGCTDQKCQYAGCSTECSQWIGKTYQPADLPTERLRQQVFINCVGYCLDPLELAGVGGAASAAPSSSAR